MGDAQRWLPSERVDLDGIPRGQEVLAGLPELNARRGPRAYVLADHTNSKGN
ncbi:MAG: hypothetical protein RIQ56_566 [Candidatus Parcubacteria bacterium]